MAHADACLAYRQNRLVVFRTRRLRRKWPGDGGQGWKSFAMVI